MSRWVKTIFIISLALNFAILGAMAGHRLGLWRKHHHGFHNYVIKSVPEEKRAAVEKIITDYKANHPHHKGKKREKWLKFEKLLTVEPFNRETFITTFNAEIEGHNQRWIAGGKTIADIAELLTLEERKTLLAKLKKSRKWRRRHMHKHEKSKDQK